MYDYSAELHDFKLLNQNRLEVSFRHIPTGINFKLTGARVSPTYMTAMHAGLNEPIASSAFTELYRRFYRLAKTPEFIKRAIQEKMARERPVTQEEPPITPLRAPLNAKPIPLKRGRPKKSSAGR